MKKQFLFLLWMTLLPLCGWAGDITVTMGTINKVYGEADPVITVNDFSIVLESGDVWGGDVPTKAALLPYLSYKRVTQGEDVNGTYYFTLIKDAAGLLADHPNWNVVISGQGVVNIFPKPLTHGAITYTIDNAADIVYTGEQWTTGVEFTVKDGTNTLVAGEDYELVDDPYGANLNKGAGTITIKGKGNYDPDSEKTLDFTIKAGLFTSVAFAETPEFVYNREEQTPTYAVKNGEIDLTLGTDFEVSYFTDEARTEGVPAPTNAATYYVKVTGKAGSNYEGTVDESTLDYTIDQKSLADEDITFVVRSTHINKQYTGGELKHIYAGLTVKFGNYELNHTNNVATNEFNISSYANNVNVPAADATDAEKPTITIVGKGNYKDTKSAFFNITPRPITAAEISIDVDDTDLAYDSSEKEPDFTVNDALATVNADLTTDDFEIKEWADNVNAGTASVTITGKGNYSGEKTQNFTIAKATLKIKAKDGQNKNLGTTEPALEWETVEDFGFQGDDTAEDVLSALPTVTRGDGESAGTYAITVDVAGITADNYNVVAVNDPVVYFTINKAGVTIAVGEIDDQTYGYKLPTLDKDAFDFTATGLTGGEEITGLTFVVKKGETTYAAGDMLEVGEYEVIASAAEATSDSYEFEYTASTLTINPLKIIIKAAPQAINYGSEPKIAKNTSGNTTWTNDRVAMYYEDDSTIGKTDFFALYGKWKEDFVESLEWDGYVNIKNPGYVKVNLLAEYDNKNFTVETENGAVTYNGGSIPTAFALNDAAVDNFANIKNFDGQTVDVTLQLNRDQDLPAGTTRTWKAGKWNSLILPFDISVAELSTAFGYAIFNVVDEENSAEGSVQFKLEMGLDGDIPANTPFLIKVNQDIADGTVIDFGTQTIVAPAAAKVEKEIGTTGYKFVGTYEAVDVDKTTPDYYFWYGASEKPARIKSDSENTWTIVPFACYVDQTVAASARDLTFIYEDINGKTTAIRSISADELVNGKNSGEGWYNVNGMKLQGAPAQKGIYIKDGKKVVLK